MYYFNGCSFTAGVGYKDYKQDKLIYPNLVTNNLINDATPGSSNTKIFLASSKAIIDELASTYIIQWTAVHRHWLYPAPDKGYYIGSLHDANSHDSRDNDFDKKFQIKNHDYGNFLQLFDYTRILTDLAKHHNKKILFIDGLANIENSDKFINDLVADADSNHQNFIQDYKNNFELVDWELWVNPFNSIAKNIIDQAPLDNHPGPNTQRWIADLIKKHK